MFALQPSSLRPHVVHIYPSRCSPPSICVAHTLVRRWRKRSCSGGIVVCSVSQVDNYGTVDYEKRPPLKWSSVYRKVSMMEDPSVGAATVLEKWEQDERKLSKWEVSRVAKELRKFRRFKLALDVYDWIADQKDRYSFNSSDAAIMLDLISKVNGVPSAEEYFLGLPVELKDKRTYGALLNAYAFARSKGKAEAVFQTMRNRDYATSSLVFNVMMTLYMNVEEYEKAISIITEMREKNIRLDTYSYNIWITVCAAMEDVEEMERILELMNLDDGVVANWSTYSTLASMNIRLGRIQKAEKYMKEAESRVTGRDRTSFNYLLGLYGLIDKKDDIHRIWKWYKSSFPTILNKGYHSMLSALVKVGDIDGAEEIYDEWLSSASRYDPKICNILITHYVKNEKMEKAEACVQRMLDHGGVPNPNTWGLLSEMYIAEKQTSRALSSLKEAATVANSLTKKWRPKPDTVANFLALCGEQDDRSSVEALVEVLSGLGCLHNEEYRSLVSAHAEAALQDRMGAK